jgi:MFS family permease
MQTLPEKSQKITSTIFISQSLASAGRIAISTILTIVAFNITQDRATVGWPSAIINFSSAPAAMFWGYLWDKIGRRKGLTLGLLFGMGGSIVATIAILNQSFSTLLVGMVGIGIASGVIRLARFIAAEVTPKEHRAKAISVVVLSGAIGAVIGPLLIAPTSVLSANLGWNKYIGPFGIAVILYFISSLVVYFFLRPEPLEIAKLYEDSQDESINKSENQSGRSILQMFSHLEFNVAFLAMVISQAVMVMVMRLSALHIIDIGYQEGLLSVAMSAHTLGMFAFSVYTGRLTDKLGHGKVILFGTLILYTSFYLAATSLNQIIIILALFLLGVGWNFCYVSGSALLSSQLAISEKSRIQGFNDLFLGLGSGFAGLLAANLYNQFGFALLNIISAGLTFFPLIITLWWMRVKRLKTV